MGKLHVQLFWFNYIIHVHAVVGESDSSNVIKMYNYYS